jgi:uncharacterized protein YndB with AHSA1/START domain
MTTKNELDLVISRLINAPRAAVWYAWAEPKNLAQWWCPKPWSTEVKGFDLRAGGVFDVVMHGPNGEVSPNPGIFLEVTPKKRIVFTSTLTEDWRPASSSFLPMTAIITMADEGEDTRYTATVLHQNVADCQRHLEMGFYEGWGICIDQLEAVAKQLNVAQPALA